MKIFPCTVYAKHKMFMMLLPNIDIILTLHLSWFVTWEKW